MLINWPFSKIYKIRCKDGSIKTFIKDIDKAFPLSLRDYNTRLNTEITAQQEATVKLDAEFASKIQGLLYNITEENKSIMLEFRTTYIGYQSDPCNNNNFLIRQIEKASKRQQKITELKLKIGGLISLATAQPNNRKEFMTLYQEIVNDVRGSAPEAAKIEIAENRTLAKDWSNSEDHE